MFARWIKKYKAWRLASKLEDCAEYLESFDGATCKPDVYPTKLKDYWRHFDMSLVDDIVIRDLMGHATPLRHRNFMQLQNILLDINDAIANEKDAQIEYVTRVGLQHQTDVDLENYFYDPVHGHLNVRECLEQLRQLLQAHCGILENIDDTYGQRKMLHVYYDIYKLSDLIIDVVAARGNRSA